MGFPCTAHGRLVAPTAAAAVKRRGLHELGSHGFSISSWKEYQRQDFDHELAGVRKTSAFAGEKELTRLSEKSNRLRARAGRPAS